LLLLSALCHSQELGSIETGVTISDVFLLQFNVSHLREGFIAYGPRFGFEINSNLNNVIIGPKVGYEFYFFYLPMRLNLLALYHNNTWDLRLLPEIGFLFGPNDSLMLYFMYGYGIPLLENKFKHYDNHRITLSIGYIIN
jgi:hypothetical protein